MHAAAVIEQLYKFWYYSPSLSAYMSLSRAASEKSSTLVAKEKEKNKEYREFAL